MKLQTAPNDGKNTITGHGPGWVAINGRRFERSLLLSPNRIDADWGPAAGEVLAESHLSALAALSGTVVLLGTGARQRFPAPALLRPLFEAGIGVEVMATGAACRTYNILVSEGRDVAAALVVE